MRHYFRFEAESPAKFCFEANIMHTYEAFLPDLS